jgi:hypothetical protein
MLITPVAAVVAVSALHLLLADPPKADAPAAAAPPAAADAPARDRAKEVANEEGFGAVRTPDLLERVGGDREASIEIVKGVYRSGASSIESPLPDGYPEPTPPGAIDIKKYPSVRRVEWASDAVPTRRGMDGGFWPLFNHIKERDIPMTSPVEMDYRGVFDLSDGVKVKEGGSWTMSFLYRWASQGPTGSDGDLKVVDTPAITVVSAGVRGPYGMRTTMDGLESLKTWLDEQAKLADGWRAAGEPRVFHYNGPYVRDANKWSEVQIPVVRATTSAPAAAPAAAPAQASTQAAANNS